MTPHNEVYPEAPTKTCCQCRQIKPITEFYTSKGRRDGHRCECSDCTRENVHKWYAANAEKAKAAARNWRINNPEKHMAGVLKYNAAKNLEAQRRYAAAHPERIKNRGRRYRETHAGKILERNHRYRSSKRGSAINDFTDEQWIALQELCNHRCHYCHKRFKGKLTQDHITPISKGGNHTLSNIIPACGSCNSKKGARDVLRPVQPFLLTMGNQGSKKKE